MSGAVYNEHVDKQVFFQGTVNVQTSEGKASDGNSRQEQCMSPIENICAEAEAIYPPSIMETKIFHPSVDLNKLKKHIKQLGVSPTERNNWCVVYLVLKENAIIASDASESEFIQWAKDAFGMTSTNFKHCFEKAKNLSTETWNDSIVAQKYINLASRVRAIVRSSENILKRNSDGELFHLDFSHKWSKRN